MEISYDHTYDLYKDIQIRTKGEIYLGVVGPVRTGKSTFIKQFMDILVIPEIKDEEEKNRSIDELPQSAAGKTITTTEPKFIPKEAAEIFLEQDIPVKVRLVDCVGYMVEGAAGHMEGEKERMVKTPWSKEEIPFTKAAEIGTKKVICDHSTIGIVVTTDGTIGELKRNQYISAEEKTIRELQEIKKPFVIILNTVKPHGEETRRMADSMQEKYGTSVIPLNCMQMKKEDITLILREAMGEFPMMYMEFFMPKWIEGMPETHPLKSDVISWIHEYTKEIYWMKDLKKTWTQPESKYITKCFCTGVIPSEGKVSFILQIDEQYYYEMLSELTGMEVRTQYQLLEMLRQYKERYKEYESVLEALQEVREQGYSVIMPKKEEIQIEDPVIMKHGNKYGVKIKSECPSIHMIKADIISEIAPIVGSENQAMDLIEYMKEEKRTKDGIWGANIFGKTVEQLIQEGILGKVNGIGMESRDNLRSTLQKILNESNGGMIFIII